MIRAIASPHGYGFGVVVSIVVQPAEDCGPVRVLRLAPRGGKSVEFAAWEEIEPYAAEPTLTLGDEEGRALLDALTRYYSGAEDTRALRRDYDAERKRVDQLTGALSSLALKLAEPA